MLKYLAGIFAKTRDEYDAYGRLTSPLTKPKKRKKDPRQRAKHGSAEVAPRKHKIKKNRTLKTEAKLKEEPEHMPLAIGHANPNQGHFLSVRPVLNVSPCSSDMRIVEPESYIVNVELSSINGDNEDDAILELLQQLLDKLRQRRSLKRRQMNHVEQHQMADDPCWELSSNIPAGSNGMGFNLD